ncbi:MFS general substrate transporter [Ganoderma leucocontextum]|nr:MFS general substrate transporter [Ganoderma leucocontextum]
MPVTDRPPAVTASPVLDDKSLKEPVDTAHVEEVCPEDCPDGGLRAWLVVFGVSCGMCATVGLINAWGTFQAYYQEVELSRRSSSDIAWIGSAQNAMLYAPGLAAGRLFDMGHLRLPVFAASAVFVVCTFLTAECTQYWQFLLCQGFGTGLASGILYDMGTMVLAHWFKKRLGLALACVFGGASIGGCIFPVTVKALLQHVSFAWTMRILGFITLGLLIVTNLTIARRLPGTQDLGPLVNIAEFQRPAYSFYVASLVVNTLALFTVLTYLTVSAVGDNLDANLSFDLLTIANATSTLGRIASGLLADRYGPLNILIPATLMSAIVTYAWPFATNVAAFVVIAVLIGISTGAILAILVQPFAHMGPVADVGLRIGMAFTLVTAGVIAGPPISGAIVDSTGSFKNVGYYGGSTLLLSAALMVAARHFMPVKTARVFGSAY